MCLYDDTESHTYVLKTMLEYFALKKRFFQGAKIILKEKNIDKIVKNSCSDKSLLSDVQEEYI